MNVSEIPYCYVFLVFTVLDLNPWSALKVKVFNRVSCFPCLKRWHAVIIAVKNGLDLNLHFPFASAMHCRDYELKTGAQLI